MSLDVHPLGSTGLEVTELCMGTSPLASMPQLYGYDVTDDRAIATIEAVLGSDIRFIDTSNGYGDARRGRESDRPRRSRAHVGGREDLVLATKVDPDPLTGDFSGKRVLDSYRESLDRLGVDRVPLLYLHDPERISFEEGVATGGPVEALVRLRDEGASRSHRRRRRAGGAARPLPRYGRVRGGPQPQPVHPARPFGEGAFPIGARPRHRGRQRGAVRRGDARKGGRRADEVRLRRT